MTADSNIFQPGGSVLHSAVADGTDYSYIAISGTGGGEGLSTLLAGRAPALNISIKDELDYTVNKAFNGDVLISVFGHRPVMIQITGLDIFRTGANGCEASGDRVQKFWAENNVYSNPKARILLSMSSASVCVYHCVLTGMSCERAGRHGEVQGVGDYALSFIGVAR